MKHRQITLILLLFIGIILWLIRAWWLPPLLTQVPVLEQRADLIQAIEALVSLGVLVLNGALAYLLWMSRKKEGSSHSPDFERPLEPVTPHQLRDDLPGRGGQVSWIDRGATAPSDLQEHGYLAIVGRSGQGKTREAVELIRRAVEVGLVGEQAIVRPQFALRFLADASLRQALDRQLKREVPVLLFVDDLPNFRGEELEKLTTTLAALQECKRAYVVVTARDDHLTDDHHAWLRQHAFHELALPDLDDGQTGRLIDSAAGLLQLQVDESGRQAFIDHNNGTPQLPLMGLRLLRDRNLQQVDAAAAQSVMQQSIAAAWAETRRAILKRQPAAEHVLDALAHFHAAGVRKNERLVLHYAAHLWRRRTWRPLHRWLALTAALRYLAHFEILVRDGQIIHRDEVLEGVIIVDDAIWKVGTFLVHHRQQFHNRWLRRFYRQADGHRWALFDLALNQQEQRNYVAAIQSYTVALGIGAHAWFHNNRGVTRAALGDLVAALRDYDHAIELNPTYASVYNNRGAARAALGDLVAALRDYGIAIELNPVDADVYYNRGIAHAGLGDLVAALRNYDQAIELNPAYANAYNNRGNARATLGDLVAALRDYDQAIELNPAYADAYYNRGNAYSAQGNLAAALRDYDKAIELNRAYVNAYNNRGVAYAAQGDLVAALRDYDKAIELNPADADAYNNRGVARSAQGNLVAALRDYDKAIELNPTYAAAIGNRGILYKEQGEYRTAAADLEQAIALLTNGQSKSLIHRHLGDAYAAQGDHEAAMLHYQQSLQLGGPAPGLQEKLNALQRLAEAPQAAAEPASPDTETEQA